MEKKKEVSPLDEDMTVLLDIKADDFDYLLNQSGTKPIVLALTQAAIDAKFTKNTIVNRRYGYWIKDIEPIYAAVLCKYLGYPLMKELRNRYKVEKLGIKPPPPNKEATNVL